MAVNRGPSVPWDSQWREIPGWPGYVMNQYSQVFSWRRGTVLRTWKNGWYDEYVTLRRDNKSYSRKVKTLYELVFADHLEFS